MATARKKTSKTSPKTATKATKKEAGKIAGGGRRGVIEEKVRVELSGGRFIDVRITIASAPKVGSGPRPKMMEILLVKRIDEAQVLTVSAELARHPAGGIKVGSGGPPTGRN